MAASSHYTYKFVTRDESEQLNESWRHCVHVMLYAALPDGGTSLFNDKSLPIKYTIMMQMRFDGRLGFPGGFVDADDESLESALHRELSEEMGDLPDNFKFTPSHHVSTHLLQEKKLCLHFFAMEVTFCEYLTIEKRSIDQPYFGFEVLGVLRVPLFLMWDKRGGLPSFLRNNFIGNSKDQLLQGIRRLQLLPEDVLDSYIKHHTKPDKLSNCSTN